MTHAHTLKLVPADLDRLHGLLVRAGVAAPGSPYVHPFELLADLEHLVARAGQPPDGTAAHGGADVRSRR
jgi:hypothetical protein